MGYLGCPDHSAADILYEVNKGETSAANLAQQFIFSFQKIDWFGILGHHPSFNPIRGLAELPPVPS